MNASAINDLHFKWYLKMLWKLLINTESAIKWKNFKYHKYSGTHLLYGPENYKHACINCIAVQIKN